MKNLFEFEGKIAKEKYYFKGRVLTNGTPNGVSEKVRRYYPLEEYPTLFITFSEIDPTKSDICKFVNKYGLGYDDGDDDLDYYDYDILLMKSAVNLWKAIKGKDLEFIKHHIQVFDKKSKLTVKYCSHPELKGDICPNFQFGPLYYEFPLPEYCQKEDYFRLASVVIRMIFKDSSQNSMKSVLVYSQKDDQDELRIIPDNLISALWLQFTLAKSGNKEYGVCEICETWFEIGFDPERKTGRKSKKYCSSACRFKAYRKRIKEAKKLSQGDMTYEEIAKKIGTNAEQVRQWVETNTRSNLNRKENKINV